jgi:hypothetical protein
MYGGAAAPNINVYRYVNPLGGSTLLIPKDEGRVKYQHSSCILIMSRLVSALDSGIGQLATIFDKPSIDYENIVLYSSWLITGFETLVM